MKSAAPRATHASLEELLNGAGDPALDRDRRWDRPSASAPAARKRRAALLIRSGCVAVLLVAIVAAVWWLSGGRAMIVATPSMGQAAPVGTLVFTEHVTASQVHVGDVISFHAPIGTHEIYTHRVVAIDAAGGLHTRGDINGAQDPWSLHTGDLVGRVVARWWGIGWLIRALPFLVVCGVILWLLTRRLVARPWRWPLRVFGSSVFVSVAAFLLRPFVNGALVSTTSQVGSSTATIVSTGILPIRVTASGGAHLDLVDGQIGALSAQGPAGPHGYQFTSALHLSLMWWVVLVLFWLSPLLLCLLFAAPPTYPPENRGRGVGPGVDESARAVKSSGVRAVATAAPGVLLAPSRSGGRHRAVPQRRSPAPGRQHRRRSGARRWVAGLSLAIAAFLGFVPSTEGAFAAQITNSTDTAGTATYFTCAAAAQATTANGGYFAYPLNETTFTTAADVSGNARPGTYQGTLTGNFTSSASAPCPRDTPSRAVTFAGGVVVAGITLGNAYVSGSGTALANPVVFSEEIWFKVTAANAGGRLIGFGSNTTGGATNVGTSNNYDRHIYMTSAGLLYFGVNPGSVTTISTPAGKNYADNTWHQAVATLSSAGMKLYVDGALIVSNATTTSGEVITGFWRVGYDNLAGWPNATSNYNFNGTLAWASVYTKALTATQVMEHYRAGIA